MLESLPRFLSFCLNFLQRNGYVNEIEFVNLLGVSLVGIIE